MRYFILLFALVCGGAWAGTVTSTPVDDLLYYGRTYNVTDYKSVYLQFTTPTHPDGIVTSAKLFIDIDTSFGSGVVLSAAYAAADQSWTDASSVGTLTGLTMGTSRDSGTLPTSGTVEVDLGNTAFDGTTVTVKLVSNVGSETAVDYSETALGVSTLGDFVAFDEDSAYIEVTYTPAVGTDDEGGDEEAAFSGDF